MPRVLAAFTGFWPTVTCRHAAAWSARGVGSRRGRGRGRAARCLPRRPQALGFAPYLPSHSSRTYSPWCCRFAGLLTYQMTVVVMLVAVPLAVTLFCFIVILVRVNSAKVPPSFKPPVTFSWDYSLMKTNFLSFICFIVSTPSARCELRPVRATKTYLYRHCRIDRSLLPGHVG